MSEPPDQSESPSGWQETSHGRPWSASLSARLIAGSAVLALLVATAFGILVYAVSTLNDATTRERHAKGMTAATLQLEKLVLDLDTGLRGYVLTGKQDFLVPWTSARAALPKKLRAFERLASTSSDERRRAGELATQINHYLTDYSIPLIGIARETPAATRTSVVRFEGARWLNDIRNRFSDFLAAENALASARTSSAQNRSDQAIALAIAGLFASAILITGFGLYLARSIADPVREVAAGATRLAGGELSTRLRPHGPGEVQELTKAFNRMAERLERGRRELERRNERLRESERAKSELVSVVAHELRTPLASVLGFTSVLLHREVTPEQQREYLGIIDAQGRRLAALVNDFLDVQRLEEGKLVLAQELVDVSRIVREQTQLFAGQSPDHLLDVTLPETPLPVRGDSNRLAQVVANLLSNAIKYSPQGGVVHVAGERNGTLVRVSVRDEGLGIPADLQKQIFGKFVRGHATADGIEGSGLGLAISRSLVEAHGGRISFTSTTGKGSTFWFELPTAATG
jgi:signal transduction histidine kinase